jgi:CheY-like chemotaxis protein
MPRVDGWQVLVEMKVDEHLRSIPVVVLSTASRPADRARAKALGAEAFVPKPSSFDALVAAVGSTYRSLVA